MPGDCNLVAFCVLDGYREAGLDVAHRFSKVFPVESIAAFLKRVEQRERKHLLDIGRRVFVGDARELVAAARRVERGIVVLLVEVESSDVLSVFARREAEHDLRPKRPGRVTASSSTDGLLVAPMKRML